MSRLTLNPRWKLLAGIALVVALAHFLLLRYGLSGWLDTDADAPDADKPFTFRTINPPPESPPEAKKAAPAPSSPISVSKKPHKGEDASDGSRNASAANGATDPSATGGSSEAGAAGNASSTTGTANGAGATAAPNSPSTDTVPASAFKYPPSPMSLSYAGSGNARAKTFLGSFNLPVGGAQGTLAWRPSPGLRGQYELIFSASVPGIMEATLGSRGAFGEFGLAPERYFFKNKRGERAAHFQRDKGIISFSNNKPDVALAAGAQDIASLLMYLSALLAGSADKYPPGTAMRVQVASTGKAEVWTVKLTGMEKIHPPAGEMEALKVSAESTDAYEYKLDVWYAPSLGWLPARILLRSADGQGDFNLNAPPAPL